MARYIDADKLIDELRADLAIMKADAFTRAIAESTITLLQEFPTADGVEVKHGEWIDNHNGTFVCSVCHGKSPRKRWCGDCGAKMDGGKEYDG